MYVLLEFLVYLFCLLCTGRGCSDVDKSVESKTASDKFWFRWSDQLFFILRNIQSSTNLTAGSASCFIYM